MVPETFTYYGKLYKLDKVCMYGGRQMVSAFRWIKSKQKFSSVAYIVCRPDEIGL